MVHHLGAHLSISGSYLTPLEKLRTIGGNTLQIFSSSPMQWSDASVSDEQIKEFLWVRDKLMIDPIYFHARYLINLADTGAIGEKSVQTLIHELILASRMQITGSVVHLGSVKSPDETPTNSAGYQALITIIQTVLANTPPDTYFMIENAGNRKIGKAIEEIAQIIQDVSDPRLRVCLDICHLHAAGYDFSTPEKLETFLRMFDSSIGLEKLELFHCNDSRDTRGSLRDRHANIGDGFVGLETFRLLLNHPRLKEKPFIIETPGFDKKGPDKKNLDILKSLVTPNL